MLRLRATTLLLALTLLFACRLPVRAEERTDTPRLRNHIILLDASGSMRPRYESGLRDWLIAPLLASGAFRAGDRVIVRTFDKRGNAEFVKEDAQRRYNGPFATDKILAVVPTAAESTGRATAIPEALSLALADARAFSLSGDTLIWMITDNVQDEPGSLNDAIAPFYEKIYNDPDFKFIYFFPLVRAGESEALVMYVLNYAKSEPTEPAAKLMEATGKAIGFRPVLFRPIRLQALELDRAGITFEGAEGGAQGVELEDGRVVVPLAAGQPLTGRIRFKLRSRFREWKIESAQVSNATVAVEPSPALDLGEGEQLQWQLDPRTLEVGPQETSKAVYAIDLASGRALNALEPGFLQSFFIEPEVRVAGVVRFEIVEPQMKLAFFDDAELAERIRRVKGLEEIERFLLPRTLPAAARNLALEIPIVIKVAQPARPVWVLVVVGILALGAIMAGLVMLNARTVYRLCGPDGERYVKLRMFGSVPLHIGDEPVGVLMRRFGTFKIRCYAPYVLENGAREQRLSETNSAFVITNSDDNRCWNFSIEPMARAGSTAAPSDDMFVS